MTTVGKITAYVDVKFDSESRKFFKKLYKDSDTSGPRRIARKGWRIPTEMDWDKLAEAFGETATSNAKLKSSDGVG